MPTVHHAIDVAATPDDCWRIFSDLSTWARWFPMLHRVDGELRAGGRLKLIFAAGPAHLPVDVTIEEYKPRELVRWVGGKLGVRGDHYYSFAVNTPGTTRVTS
ncbi:MAG TPA: SRPBCC family protein, partial [Polyangia bacterium]